MWFEPRESFSFSATASLCQTPVMITVLLVDDHAIVREGFKRLLEGEASLRVVAEAQSSQQALSAAEIWHPDLAVLDISLGKGDSGLSLLGQMAQVSPATRCVILSMHDDPAMVSRALESGARGYVTKTVAANELVDILQRVLGGEQVLSSDLLPNSPNTRSHPQLSPRELQTLAGILSGNAPKAIAANLQISDKTLYRHRANLMEKLGARTSHDLGRIAIERGLLAEKSH